ncbi:methionyl-tRNA formyltransferase [Tardiphaga sp. OK246]|uniref:formyltransferase family protein n=1 Tax=Tardiphaga sp. OK246 TaxID=1855307 RepID=UPI000B73BD9E|nr:formyltransferase family protein [Tardiphaga sp. OK246]SNT63954.1 methionyl-tRNA formyltransferase [Tardiphaga sp. OK246]
MRLLLMADGTVGLSIFEWLASNWAADLALVVTTSKNAIFEASTQHNIPCAVFTSESDLIEYADQEHQQFDLGFLAWWPKLLRRDLLALPIAGFVNTHPSFLPYNRGKHYNFWALVEQVPFGVTLHKVDEGVDTGEIVSQRQIEYGWEDNGASLYSKAQQETVVLVKDCYPDLRTLKLSGFPQPIGSGSYHQASELEQASHINLDRSYTGRELLNLLRARTFRPHPACWFSDGDDVFEVRIEIEKRDT